jgi:outer membrane protein assembly factor BamB
LRTLPLIACVLVVLAAPLAAAAAVPAATDWTLPNLNRSSTRAVLASPLTPRTVSKLRVLWRFRFAHATVSSFGPAPESLRGVVATPIVAGNSIYIQDATSAVYAIDRATGTLRWEHQFDAPNYGRNGVSYSSGSVYASTDTTVIALSAATGQLLWQRRLVTPTEQFIDIAPLIANNLVYVSTVGYPPGGRGAIYALNAHNGAVRWKFTTIRGPWPHPAVAGGGGAWYTPSLDPNGELYVGIANPYPLGGTPAEPNGAAFAGPALYTDSVVVLDARSGKLLRFSQVTPHDIRDYDFELPPILASVGSGSQARSLVLGAGKAGIVVAWSRGLGTRLWQTVVGRHLHDRGPLPRRAVEVCPGFYGGVESAMAFADGTVFVPVVNLCARGDAVGYQAVGTLNPVDGSGAFVALDASNGALLWQRSLPQPDFGCATAAAGVVFTSSFDGHLYAFDAADGTTLWQTRAPTGINGCPALSGDMLLVPSGSATTAMRNPHYELVAYGLR